MTKTLADLIRIEQPDSIMIDGRGRIGMVNIHKIGWYQWCSKAQFFKKIAEPPSAHTPNRMSLTAIGELKKELTEGDNSVY